MAHREEGNLSQLFSEIVNQSFHIPTISQHARDRFCRRKVRKFVAQRQERMLLLAVIVSKNQAREQTLVVIFQSGGGYNASLLNTLCAAMMLGVGRKRNTINHS